MKCFHGNLKNLIIAAAAVGIVGADESTPLTFAVIPKSTKPTFFKVVEEGCLSRASALPDVSCMYLGTEDESDAVAQAGIIDAIINGTHGKVDGISVSVIDATISGEAIDRAVNAGIPTITFDSDAADSLRKAYIGTDNYAMGVGFGKLLEQLSPRGGSYGIVASGAPNLLLRVEGARERLRDTKWVEVDNSFKNSLGSPQGALELMHEFVDENVDAIISVGGWPMWASDQWKDFVDANRHLTLIVADGTQDQIALMKRGYVNGLVGQLPFSMGEMSMDMLLRIVQGVDVGETIHQTALLEMVVFPLDLPKLVENENYIGNLTILGYALLAVIVACSLGFMFWTFLYQNTRVVRASQPFFLHMIIVGVLIFASAIVPLSFDSEQYSQEMLDGSCMAIPWLMTIGFTTMFSALLAKTWRVNKILNNPNAFQRVTITEKDVMKPYLTMMGMNIFTLSCWTTIAPLKYQRFNKVGTDDWNRVIATYGVCATQSQGEKSKIFWPFLLVIILINIGLLVLANVQAYRARSIQTEYSESKYILIIMACMLQIFLLGVPCMFLLWRTPPAYFTILTMLIFCISGCVLMFIFLPKVYHTRRWMKERNEAERNRLLERARVMQAPCATPQRSDNGQPSGDDLENVPGLKFTTSNIIEGDCGRGDSSVKKISGDEENNCKEDSIPIEGQGHEFSETTVKQPLDEKDVKPTNKPFGGMCKCKSPCVCLEEIELLQKQLLSERRINELLLKNMNVSEC